MAREKKKPVEKMVASFEHDQAKRRNIPTAELQSIHKDGPKAVKELKYPRNADLDPQLVWRGKDEQDWSDLVAPTPPLYIQEKVHPKALIDELLRGTKQRSADTEGLLGGDLFQDFDGIPHGVDKTEFYQHDQRWANRMILGDSLQAMASLAERESLRGKVQCIYFDPPYGIKFNSNFQWSTASRDVKDGKADHITREPEQVKAFRDTWRNGIHSYLAYLRDRLTVSRDLLSESGSIFVQISDENVHRVRALLDEVFGEDNFVSLIPYATTTGSSSDTALPVVCDYIVWYAKSRPSLKFHQPYYSKEVGGAGAGAYSMVMSEAGVIRRMTEAERESIEKIDPSLEVAQLDNITSSRPAGDGDLKSFAYEGKVFTPGRGTFKTDLNGLNRLAKAGRIGVAGNTLRYIRKIKDFAVYPVTGLWTDTTIAGFASNKRYIVETSTKVIQRCVLMTTDPGDLVLDPTCGSGTTAYVAEQWGRRWITIDTSRVALALARTRIMGAKYPFYLLADSRDGQMKEAEVSQSFPSSQPTHGNIRHGFVYERVPHVMLSSITSNAEIDVVWDNWQKVLEPLRTALNSVLGKAWQEWEIPHEPAPSWPAEGKRLHAELWTARIGRQRDVDKSIAAKAESEFLYDKPYEDKKKVRVAGPFTVESLTPHRTLVVNEEGDAVDLTESRLGFTAKKNFTDLILENLKAAGVQQAHKEDKIMLSSLSPWPGDLICAEGRYREGDVERRAAIFIGPEFGTVQRPDLVQAAREAADAKFDVLITCAFNYDGHSTDFNKLGSLPVLKARMNADLHMAEDLKNTGKGNLFVIFGEPDIDLITDPDGQIRVKVNGVDVFKPQLGKVESSNTDEIACWFIDTDYNEESFFVRHAYFLGANDPYDSLKSTLRAEIDKEAWDSLNSDTSRPFPKPKSKRIAVKVINHLGDEVMRIFKVE